jgi:cathepsin A (carboxypeptidase C)
LILLLAFQVYAIFHGEKWTTGDIDLGNGGDTIFYYLFSARNVTNRGKKLLIWFNGGPGCSSSTGLFTENGPYMFFNKSSKLSRNPYSWNTDYDLMFVDQPVGVGYSQAKNKHHFCTTELCVTKNFYIFLVKFLQEDHPEYVNIPIYLTGESYAGHYIPAIAATILRAKNTLINLQGVAIGNGMMDRALQILSYPDYVLEQKNISWFPYVFFKSMAIMCNIAIPYRVPIFDQFCLGTITILRNFSGLYNPYDIRRSDNDDILDNYTLEILNNRAIQKSFGIKSYRYVDAICNETLYESMRPDLCTSVMDEMSYMLENELDVLMYSGDKDYQCNYLSNELVANNVKWAGQEEFKNARYSNFTIQARFKKHKNFIFMIVKDAGHMVPMDQPPFALEMLKSFLEDKIGV